MKVLVTGANGLIGAVTVSYLLERGYDVRAVDLTEETKLNDVEYAACDIRNTFFLKECLKINTF